MLGNNAHMLQFVDEEKVKKWEKDMTPEELQFAERTKIKGTDEYQAAQIWDKLRHDLWNKMFLYTQRWSNRAIKEEFDAQMGKKYIDDYFTRRVSDEFLQTLSTIETQPYYIKLFNEQMRSYSRTQANKLKINTREGETDL